jgi:predicted nucleic acid-binding protein
MLAGTWRRLAHERGYRLSLPDALIASAADAVDAAVLTRNVRDFALTPVRIETY